jgi:hypothetical protein
MQAAKPEERAGELEQAEEVDSVPEAQSGSTKATLVAGYTVPLPLLGRIAEAIVVKVNEHEAEALLANLKARMAG